MRKLILSLLFTLGSLASLCAQYKPDILGSEFEQRTLRMPDDYEGEVVATLVRRLPLSSQGKAILYIHGYNDYFFQEEMARVFNNASFNFYAVDLRKYGRSMLPHQVPFQVHNLKEYFAEIDSAITILQQEGNREIVLMGHSTGGLITSLYCHHNRNNLAVQGLILNSPFLDMNMSWGMEHLVVPTAALYGRLFKNTQIAQGGVSAYGLSLLSEFYGEWEFDCYKKFIEAQPLTTGWLRAIHQGHRQVARGLQIPIPILVMYSDNTVTEREWTPAHQHGDAVLDVNDIKKYGKRLGGDVTEAEIAGGMHDLVLSRKAVRLEVYRTMFRWLKTNNLDN